jgi:peptidoglycan/xylan/chitin deacetylase (PgdA/CDA1 family)
MYHSISDEDEGSVHPYFRIATAPDVFREHIGYLHANGYRTLSLADAASKLDGCDSRERTVVITFDDGYADFYHQAFPILSRYGFTATVFLPTEYIGNTQRRFQSKPCMVWRQISELHKAGIDFGSHTVTHRRLDLLSAGELGDEILGSKRAIEDNLGCAAESFAYPFAFPQSNRPFKRMLGDLLRKFGYKQGVCTTVGTADGDGERFFMRRLPMNSCDDLPLLAAKLAGAYDWLAKPQYLAKWAKTHLLPNHIES